MKIVIDRATFDAGSICYLNGKKCALGFLAYALGYKRVTSIPLKDGKIWWVGPDEKSLTDDDVYFALYNKYGKDWCHSVYNVNDKIGKNKWLTDAERDSKLVELFAEKGLELEFTGE